MVANIIIIGAGPGGYETAVYAAKHDLSVVIIEENKPGGTCLHEGCIPTKTFCKNASLLEELKDADTYGIHDLSYSFDFAKVVERKNGIVGTLVGAIETLMKNKLITYVQGKASFKDEHTVLVNGEEYTAPNIVIATGSVTKYLPIEGASLPGVITSKEILDITRLPQHLCVIGAGVIGMEFASIFNAFGSKVTVLEFMKDILPNFDSDLAKRLKQVFAKKEIEIVNQAAVQKIGRAENGQLSVSYELKGEKKECVADTVLMAVGRVANTGSLNLSDIGLSFSKKGIETNEYMQTSLPHIYAIGDVNGRCLLAHAATFQGLKAVNHILGKPDSINLDIVPSAVFTLPEAAMVGLTEEMCKEQGIAYKAKKSFFRANGKALTMGEPEGYCKLLVDESGKIIGCHLFGAHSADLIQEISSLMHQGTNINEYKDIIHAHPTLSEVIQKCGWEF
jgi:dihydrolipoamide dehydrogenase